MGIEFLNRMIMKRVMDVLIAYLGLPLLLPLFILIALTIWLTSGSPVIFSQVRVGRKGREFILYKFRTMTQKFGAEAGFFEPGERARITAVGRMLRAFKLDELPQLWNVIKGDMSLVGPRPEVSKWVAVYPEYWKTVLSIKPGITDPASVAYRDEESLLACSINPEATYRETILPRKLEIYRAYLDGHTFLGDLKIIYRTILGIAGDFINFLYKRRGNHSELESR